MSNENNDFGSMPLDMIIEIMKAAVVDGFGNFFNLFKAWAQTKRGSEITHLLELFPVRDLYPARLLGNDSDVACFDKFFTIAERLQNADAIVYKRVHEFLGGVGNLDAHLIELDGLASGGHYLAMMACVALRFSFQKHVSSASIIPCLLQLYGDPHFDSRFESSLIHLQNIKEGVAAGGRGSASNSHATCPILHTGVDGRTKGVANGVCFLCDIFALSKVFMKG